MSGNCWTVSYFLFPWSFTINFQIAELAKCQDLQVERYGVNQRSTGSVRWYTLTMQFPDVSVLYCLSLKQLLDWSIWISYLHFHVLFLGYIQPRNYMQTGFLSITQLFPLVLLVWKATLRHGDQTWPKMVDQVNIVESILRRTLQFK